MIMNDEIYGKLARVLDALPCGFPATRSGVEIGILKKIFTPEEADLFCDLKLTCETAEQIAKRTGRPLPGLEERLLAMCERGEVLSEKSGPFRAFKMVPWAFGYFNIQNARMDFPFRPLCLLPRLQPV
jgi:hypothetical protein